MTDDELTAIAARANAATPGPWMSVNKHIVHPRDVGGEASEWPVIPDSEADAEFIAHAREDVPALVAEVRRLRGALKDAGIEHVRVYDVTYGEGADRRVMTVEAYCASDAVQQVTISNPAQRVRHVRPSRQGYLGDRPEPETR